MRCGAAAACAAAAALPAPAGADGAACALYDAAKVRRAYEAAVAADPEWNTTAACSGGQPSGVRGPYDVNVETIAKVPGLSQGGPTSAGIWYPSNPNSGDKFPFISFAHGTTVGSIYPQSVVSYCEIMRTVASFGFIVVAPNTCPAVECGSGYAKDQLATITACKADPSLHPALARADFSRVGVTGHSMGAMATITAAGGGLSPVVTPAQYNIKAAVALHPCQDGRQHSAGVSVPIMFTCGSTDTICGDGCAKRFYGNVPAGVPKVLLDIKGAGHFEPASGPSGGSNAEDGAVAHFFDCWLRGGSCDKVYGASGKAVCTDVKAGSSASSCTVAGGGPGPSPPTPPAPSPPAPTQLYACKANVCVAAASGLDKAACEAACGAV